MLASQSLVAFSMSVSRTGCRSIVDWLMTFNTSAVAVCWSKASIRSRLRSCNSLNSRTFSMAITAWSAKVLRSAIWFSVNGRTSCATNYNRPDCNALS